jgi:aspartate 1-decarboxylase
MSGGLIQLVAYGAQDAYLTGNPQITHWKVVYRRHTNFSVEPIQQTWNGAADFGRTVTCNINRNGDLITNMYVAVTLAAGTAGTWGYVRRLGHAMLDNFKVEIGGSKIDEQYGDWLNIWYELSHKVGQERGYAEMIGDTAALRTIEDATNKPQTQLYVPLQFWFNRNNGLALPLIALQYHDVRVTLKFRDAAGCVNYNGTTAPTSTQLPSMADCYLLIDYVYLDSEERKRFAQASHEYLMEQLQFTGSESLPSLTNKYRLNFNHPSKFLVWASHLERYNNRSTWVAYADNGDWEAAKSRFSKLVWAAARLMSNTQIAVTRDAGELDDGSVSGANNGATLATVAAKVDARIVSAAGAGNQVVDIDDIVLINTTVTMEDMSQAIADLVSGAAQTWSETFLEANGVSAVDYFNYANYVDGTNNTVAVAKLQLNGHDRFQERDGNYFNYVQPHQHFSNTPADGVNVYSFALRPEEHQPSGTCNFSRIDNATLNVTLGRNNAAGNSAYLTTYVGGASSNSVMNIYTVNYNILRVMSGMAGVAYSN